MFSISNQNKLIERTETIKVLTFAGLPPHQNIKLDFLFLFSDFSEPQRNVYSNLKLDGNTIFNQELFKYIDHSASTLTLEWLQNCKRHDWEDNRTTTIVTVTVNGIKCPLKTKNIVPDKTIHAYSNFNFTLNANISHDFAGNNLMLNAYLNNDFPKATCQSCDPTIIT